MLYLTYKYRSLESKIMKKTGVLIAMLLGASLFFTSCEKECFNLPGNNTQQNFHKDGEAGTEDDIIDDDDEDGEDLDGITDGGRDEDYDKSGKSKKPKPN